MANLIYNSYKKAQFDLTGSINLASDTIKCMLVTSSYTPDIDAHAFKSSVTNEVSGTGYTAGGATLASKAVTQDNTGDKGVFDAADTSWASASFTARGAVLYKDTGTPSTSPLVAYIDFGSDYTCTNGTFSIVWNSNGIINLT